MQKKSRPIINKLGPIIMIVVFGFLYKDDLISYWYGMNYKINEVERKKLEIREIPKDYLAVPKISKHSSTQYWINKEDSHGPRHHLKYVYVLNRFDSINFEQDRFIIKEKPVTNLELVISYSYYKKRRNINPWSYAIKEYPKTDSRNWFEWNKENETLDTLTRKEAFSILDSLMLRY